MKMIYSCNFKQGADKRYTKRFCKLKKKISRKLLWKLKFDPRCGKEPVLEFFVKSSSDEELQRMCRDLISWLKFYGYFAYQDAHGNGYVFLGIYTDEQTEKDDDSEPEENEKNTDKGRVYYDDDDDYY